MKYYFLPFLFLSIFASPQAQKLQVSVQPVTPYKNSFCQASFENIAIPGYNNQQNIETVLKDRLLHLHDKRCGLKLNYINQSPGGLHYSFTQTFNGIPVYQSEIKANTDRKNTIRSLFDNSYSTTDWQIDLSKTDSNSVIAIDPTTGAAVLAELNILHNSTEVISVNSAVIFQRNLNTYLCPPDSTVSGKVFNPDPLTTANEVYGGIYINNLDQDAPWLDAQEQTVSFKASFNDTVFSLQSAYVNLLDFDSPRVTPATETIPQFYFNRSQTGFEDVMGFYHLSTYHDYITGLGFDCANHEVDIDTHANSGGFDNSYFGPGYTPKRIFYSTGGVPDAQDADVLVHEYGHFLSSNAAPNSNSGEERNALDEAFGDYNAASYSKSLNTFNDQWVFNWDGHNEFWNGRIVNSTHVYPADLDQNIYDDGEIWSSMLFSLNGDIGRETSDQLIVETHYSYAAEISMAHAAQLLLKSDTLLFNGEHYCAIYKRLLEHGFVAYDANNPCGILGINEVPLSPIHFMQNGYSFTLVQDKAQSLQVDIYNSLGEKVIATIPVEANRAAFTYTNTALANGIYIITAHSENEMASFKWVKIK